MIGHRVCIGFFPIPQTVSSRPVIGSLDRAPRAQHGPPLHMLAKVGVTAALRRLGHYDQIVD
jgi:hypothetical protein